MKIFLLVLTFVTSVWAKDFNQLGRESLYVLHLDILNINEKNADAILEKMLLSAQLTREIATKKGNEFCKSHQVFCDGIPFHTKSEWEKGWAHFKKAYAKYENKIKMDESPARQKADEHLREFTHQFPLKYFPFSDSRNHLASAICSYRASSMLNSKIENIFEILRYNHKDAKDYASVKKDINFKSELNSILVEMESQSEELEAVFCKYN